MLSRQENIYGVFNIFQRFIIKHDSQPMFQWMLRLLSPKSQGMMTGIILQTEVCRLYFVIIKRISVRLVHFIGDVSA